MRMYFPRIKEYLKKLSKTELKDFVFYNYNPLFLKIKTKFIRSCSNTQHNSKKNYPDYIYKNHPRSVSLEPCHSFTFHDHLFSQSDIEPITDKKLLSGLPFLYILIKKPII